MRAGQRAPAFYALCFFIVGILLAAWVQLPSLMLLGIAIALVVTALVCHLLRKQTLGRIALCTALVAAGAGNTELQTSEFPANHISRFTAIDEPVTIVGTICSEPDIRLTKTFMTVSVDSLTLGSRTIPVSGRIRLQVRTPTSRFNFRDRIRFRGRLEQPSVGRNPGTFDYRRYLRIRDVYGLVTLATDHQIELLRVGDFDPFIRNLIVPVREYIISLYERYLPPERAAVMRGFLIGDVRHISQATYQRFKDTGTLHVLAASGANVAYVVTTVFLLLKLFRLPRRFNHLLALIAIVIFSFLAYNQPSVVRASVMGATGLVGLLLYRDVVPLNIISFSALLILAVRPLYLLDTGFQLSYAAAFGLVIYMPAINRRLSSWKGVLGRAGRWLLMLIAVTVTAQLWVMPVLVNSFHRVPLVTFLSNLLVVPLVGVVTAVGIILVMLSGVPLVAGLLGDLLSELVGWALSSIDYFQGLPVPTIITASLPVTLVIAYYAALLALAAWLTNRRTIVTFLLLTIAGANLFLWSTVFREPTPVTRITFLDTESANTVLVRAADGGATLINGGGMKRQFDRGRMVVAPVLQAAGIDHLDQMIATDSSRANLISIGSLLSALDEGWPATEKRLSSDEYPDSRVELRDPVVGFEYEGYVILMLLESIDMNLIVGGLPDSVEILACDWSFLASGSLDRLLDRLNTATIVLTSYPNLRVDTKPLQRFRAQHPDITLYTTLESGGITVEIRSGFSRVLPTINR